MILREKLFIIIVAVCLLSVAMFMIGGAIQDVDMHDVKTDGIPLEEQYDEYEKLNTQKSVGETIQFIAACVTLLSLVGLMLSSAMISDANSDKAIKKAENA